MADESMNPSPAPVPEAPDTSSLPLQQAPESAQVPQPQAQGPAKPSLWKDVLQGALAGLAGSAGAKHFGGGLALGAAGELVQKQRQFENQQAAQAQASRIKFQDAQSAAAVADAAYRDAQLHALPQQLQDDHNKAAAGVVDTYTQLFGNPTAVVNNNGQDAQQHLETVSGAQGGVGHMLIVNTGDKLYAWDTGAASQAPQAFTFVKNAGSALGIAPLSGMTADAWKNLPPQKKQQYMDMADDLYNTVVPGKDLGTMNGQISRLQTAQQTLKQKVNSDPALKPLRDNVERNLKIVQTAKDTLLKDQQDLGGKIAENRGRSYGEYRPVNVIDPNTGELKVMFAKDAIAGGAAPAPQGAKAMAQSAQLNDIATGSQNMRQAVQSLDSPFSSADVALLTAAMRSTDPKVTSQLIDRVGASNLSDKQQTFLTALTNLHERAMALRSVAGIGQQGSDTMRAAIVNMLPALKDNPSLMLKKLDAFDQQLRVLSRGIPKVKGAPAAGAAEAAPIQAPAATESSFFHKFGGQARQQ